MTRSTGRLAIAALALGLATNAGAAPQSAPELMPVANIPVAFTSATPDIDRQALCDRALENVAIGRPVPFRAAGCLRAFVLEADPATQTAARPAPEACESLLPSLAVGEPVLLGAAVPCIEDYVLTGADQVAER